VHYFFSDHLGTTDLVTDAVGTMPAQTESDYYPYGGEIVVTTPTISNQNYKFTGKERDSQTGLDYFGARYFTSTLGRFMTPDPLPWAHWQNGRDSDEKNFAAYIENPQNFDLYSYVRNAPLTSVDPNGETTYVVAYSQGNKAGDENFYKMALTRMNEIQSTKGFNPTKDIVLVESVDSFKAFTNVVNEANGLEGRFGKIGEVTYIGHAGQDGPIFREGTTHQEQPGNKGGDAFFKLQINWAPDAVARFYGCKTAFPTPWRKGGSFAGEFANDQGVRTWGFDQRTSVSGTPVGKDKKYFFGLGGPDLYLVTWKDKASGSVGGQPMVEKDPSH